MQEQVNNLILIAPVIGRVLDRIDPHNLIVGRRPYEFLQLANQIVMVRITRAESVETLSKTRFTDRGSDAIHSNSAHRSRVSQKCPLNQNLPKHQSTTRDYSARSNAVWVILDRLPRRGDPFARTRPSLKPFQYDGCCRYDARP